MPITDDGVLSARILFALRGGRPRGRGVLVSGLGVGFGLAFLAGCDGVGTGKGAGCCTGLSGSKPGLATSFVSPVGRGVDGVDLTVHLVPDPVRRKVGTAAATGVRGGGIGVLAVLCAGVGDAAGCGTRRAGIADCVCCLLNGELTRL